MNENANEEVRAARRLLNEISQLCEHANLTGSLSGGAKRVALRYNAVLASLVKHQAVDPELFSPIPENAEFGEVGVEARMLAASIRETEAPRAKSGTVKDPGILIRLAPFIAKEDLSKLVREQLREGAHFDIGILTSLAPFLAKEDMGKLLQEHLRQEAPVPPAPPQPPTPPDLGHDFDPEPNLGWPFQRDDAEEEEHHAPQSLHEALEILRNPNLSGEERDRLIRQVREFAGE